MATNEILPFAQGVGANVQSQVDYAAESLRTSGNVAGIARSNVNNKALRQASVIAAGVAQFMADNQPNDVTDSLTPTAIAAFMEQSVQALSATDYLNTTRINVASAATVDLTASAPNTRHINITGTTTINRFTVAAGQCYFVTFASTATLVNSASLVTGSGANITAAANDTCVIYATAANTVQVMLYKRPSDFAPSSASFTGNGYQKLPSGLIIQWGTVSVSSAGTGITGEGVVTFPVAFPNAALSVSASYELTGGAINGALSLYHRSLSASGVRFGLDEASSTTTTTSVKWIAIGY